MATTTKLDKRDLKAPDEFMTLGTRAATYVAENSAMVIGGTLLVLVAIAAGFGWMHKKGEREVEASGKLFAAEKLLSGGQDETSRMLGISLPGSTSDEDKKKALEQFEKVAADYPGTQTARRARLRAGDLNLQLGQYDAAITSWELALDGAGPEVTYYARNGIAHAYEAKNSWNDAANEYRKLANDESIMTRDNATLDLARALVKAGNAEEARTLLSGFAEKFPKSSLTESVEKELAKLGGPIATPESSPASADPATTSGGADGSGG